MTTPVDEEPARGPLAWDAIRIVTVGLLTIVALVVSFLCIYLVTYVQEQREILTCLQGQVAELNTSYVAARTAAGDDRAAQRDLLLSPGETLEERLAARDRFLERLDTADRNRSASPPPTELCL